MNIGISGWRGAGKTALANYLAKHHNYKVLSFSTPLKFIGEMLFPGTSDAPKEKNFKEYDWTPRELHLRLGEFGRFHDLEIWVSQAVLQVKPKGNFVFDDVRFPNEVEALKKLGFKIIRVNRYEHQNPYGKHLDIPSESSLDKFAFDYVIEDCQNTTIKELYKCGDIMVKELR